MSPKNPSELITISGTIRVVGQEPFSYLVLSVGDDLSKAVKKQDYLIVGPLEKRLKGDYQWKRVKLEGMICLSPTPEFTKCFKPSRILSDQDQ
ncbi:MAG TPA: hypothetical protein ENG95_00345, partial [Nitrospirae bacterium]|nr:hypothetical protein [Nitrospirota bacterium]